MEVLKDDWTICLQQIKSKFYFETVHFFKNKGMMFPFLPLTTSSISSPFGIGSDSLPVPIDLFGEKTYLADSMQFYLEYSLRIHEKGVFYIMPSFRGEKADERHLCQFYHVEAEIHGGVSDVKKLVNEYLFFVTDCLYREMQGEIRKITKDLSHIEKFLALDNVPSVLFKDAIKLLGDNKEFIKEYILDNQKVKEITNAGEKELIKLFNGAVWLDEMPAVLVPFYQSDVDEKYSSQTDLLLGIGETVGAGERHLNKENVLGGLNRRDVNPIDYEWYVRMKEETPIQTSGFGLGVERYLLWLLNHSDIRDMQMIPRFNGVKITP